MSTIEELEKKLAQQTSAKNLFIRYYYQHQEMLADLLKKYKDVQTTDFEHTQNQFQAMLEELQKQISKNKLNALSAERFTHPRTWS
jgi:hypothetical protein